MTARRKIQGDALAALRRVLGAPPPPGVAALDAEELTRLGEAIEDAKGRHSEALTLAVDEALLQVPSLLRGPVRRIVLR
jgi:hypothetical protein